MKFQLLSTISFLTFVFAATDAALAPEVYWKSMLPTTPMPESLKVLLHPTGGGATVHSVSEIHDSPKILSKIIYKHGEPDDTPRTMSKILYKHGETDDTPRTLSKILYKHAETDDTPRTLSKIIYKHGETDDTPRTMSKIIYKHGETDDTPRTMSKIIYKHGETDDTPRTLSKILYKHAETDDTPRTLSKIVYKHGETDDTPRTLSKIVYKHDETDDTPRTLSKIFYKHAETDDTPRTLSKIVYKHGETDDTPRTLSKIVYKHGETDDTPRTLSKIVYKHDETDDTPRTLSKIIYKHDETDDKPRILTNETIFFLEKDLKEGQKVNLLFMQTSNNHASFLPRHVVKSIPFSSTKMAEILNKFGVKRGSADAERMKTTIKVCEETGIKGEDKYCATSLESMVDFATSKLGKNVKALSTEAMMKETKIQEYTITHGVKKVGETQVVCHKMNYVYAVFYCHKIENTVAYTVSLQGADGSRVKAVSVCHRDTSDWNPKHLAFKLLKVKPGTVPICHFLTQSTVMWVPGNK